MKALSIAFSALFTLAAALFGAAGLLVIASLLLADTKPRTSVSLGIHLGVGGVFLALGFVLLGLMLQVAGLARMASRPGIVDTGEFRQRLLRLLILLVISGLFITFVMSIVTYAILSRIDEGFAVFG